jgi:D-glycero-alpha-D-manno-heptose-7-phosphate kinase
MIISRTPFRISFFGGGTDYPAWCRENCGAVLATTIDKYCYITCRALPPFFDHKHRIVYSLIENVKEIDEIKHPAVREVFRFMNIQTGLEVHHDGDLPARSGLGSSSSFTVGLLHALYALQGKMVSKDQLARDAIYIEQEMIKENVGAQDQVSASYGGFNKIIFNQDGSIDVRPVLIKQSRLDSLQGHLMLVFTRITRIASDIASEQIRNTAHKKNDLTVMHEMVDQACGVIGNDDIDIAEFGRMMHESWMIKKSLSDKISNGRIDDIYDAARKAGAIGGKILGAGGGGFLLLFAKPEDKKAIREKLSGLLEIPFTFENTGSQIIVYKPEYYSNHQIVENSGGTMD